MIKQAKKLVAILMIIALIQPTLVFASNDNETVRQYATAEEPESLTDVNTHDFDIFNVRVAPGTEHCGYIFRLTEDAKFSLEEAINVRALSLVLNIFYAATLQDIIDFAVPGI